jgi:hypothetical protein
MSHASVYVDVVQDDAPKFKVGLYLNLGILGVPSYMRGFGS